MSQDSTGAGAEHAANLQTIIAGSASLPTFEKLKGQENFSLWKFQMKGYLDYDDLWDITDPSKPANLMVSEVSATKVKQRFALFNLSISDS